jgi:hypothetical protein
MAVVVVSLCAISLTGFQWILLYSSAIVVLVCTMRTQSSGCGVVHASSSREGCRGSLCEYSTPAGGSSAHCALQRHVLSLRDARAQCAGQTRRGSPTRTETSQKVVLTPAAEEFAVTRAVDETPAITCFATSHHQAAPHQELQLMDVASKERHDRQFEDFKMRNKRHVPDLQHRLTLPQFEARTCCMDDRTPPWWLTRRLSPFVPCCAHAVLFWRWT